MFLFATVSRGKNNPATSRWQDNSTDRDFRFECGSASVILTRRAEYPVTSCDADGTDLRFGYGSRGGDFEGGIGEFLSVSINADNGSVSVTRDDYCTWPLFIFANDDKLVFSSDLRELVERVGPVKINDKSLDRLISQPEPEPETLFDGVRLLKRNETFTWEKGTLESQMPQLAPIDPVSKNPRDFRELIETVFEKYMQLPGGAKFAYEVSGGIDSATLPLFTARNGFPDGVPPVLASMLFPGRYAETQERKLEDLAIDTGLEGIAYPVNESEYPLSRFFRDGFKPEPFYQYQEIYTEVLDGLARELESQGVKVVYTGIGGDELFENPGGSTDSAFWAGQSRNSVYISRNIWPIAPLADRELRSFAQHLPVAFRANKNILRAYHQANGFPESVYNPELNEDFADFFDNAMLNQYRRILDRIQPDSVLAENGLVDWEDIRGRIEHVDIGDQESVKDLFLFFRLATAELILRSVPKEKYSQKQI